MLRRYCNGQKVLAKYSEDGKWYNGVVLQMFPDGSVDINYENYGNCETVSPADIVVDSTELPPDSILDSHVTAQAEGQGEVTPWLEVSRAMLVQGLNTPCGLTILPDLSLAVVSNRDNCVIRLSQVYTTCN